MPTRPQHTDARGLTEQHIWRLITGRSWYFREDPPAFADDAAALACYRTLRPELLRFCQEQLGGLPWAESLLTGQPTAPIAAPLQHCRAFLRLLAQEQP